MFSIDRLLEEVLSFVKRFFQTFYRTAFQPKATLRLILLQKQEGRIGPVIYFLISTCLFFNLQLVDTNHFQMPLAGFINTYEKNFSEYSFTSRILYVIPIAALLYLLVKFIGWFLRSDKNKRTGYEKFCFYCIGNSCLLFILSTILYNLIDFLVESSKYNLVVVSDLYYWMSMGLFAPWYISSFVLPGIAVSKEAADNKAHFRIYVTIPIISLLSVPIIYYSSDKIISALELRSQEQFVGLRSTNGSNVMMLKVDTLQENPSLLSMKFDAVVYNTTRKSYYFNNSGFLRVMDTTIHIFSKGDLHKYRFDLRITALNGSPFMGGAILKPDDMFGITMEAVVDTSTFNRFLPPAPYDFLRERLWEVYYDLTNVNGKKERHYTRLGFTKFCFVQDAVLHDFERKHNKKINYPSR